MSTGKYSSVENPKVQIETICEADFVDETETNNDIQSFEMEINREKVGKNRITIKSWAKKPTQLKLQDVIQDTVMLATQMNKVNKNIEDSSTAINQVSISSSYLKTLMKAPNAFTIPLATLQMITKSRGNVCHRNQGGNSELSVQLPKESVLKLGTSENVQKVNKLSITLDCNESSSRHPVSTRSQDASDDEDVDDNSQLSISNTAAVTADEHAQSSPISSPLSPDLIDESSVEFLDSFDPVTVKQPCIHSINHEIYDSVDYELPSRRGNKRKRSLSTSYPFQQSKLQFTNARKVSIKRPPRDPLDVNHSNSFSNDTNLIERKSKISLNSNSVATQKQKFTPKQLQIKKIQKYSSKSSNWNNVNNSLNKPVTSNKLSMNVNHLTLGSNVIKINPPSKVMQSIKANSNGHHGASFVFSSKTKQTNELSDSDNPSDMCATDSMKVLQASCALSPLNSHSCSVDSSCNGSQLNPITPYRTQLAGLVKSKKKVIITIDTSKNETSILQSRRSKLPVSSSGSQNRRKEEINLKSSQVMSDSMWDSNSNGNPLLPNILPKKIVPQSGAVSEDSSFQHFEAVNEKTSCTSAKQSKEKASQTATVTAILKEKPTDQPSLANIVNCERFHENCCTNAENARTNTVHCGPAVTNTYVTQCINNPIHYFANTLSSCKPGLNGSPGLRIALPSSVIHTIPVDTININSEKFQIPSMTLMPAVPQYVFANPNQKTTVPDTSLAALTHSFTMPTKKGTCINMPSLEKAFRSSQVLGIGVLPVPPPAPASSMSSYKCQAPSEVPQNPTKKLKLKENRVLIKVFTGKRFLMETPPHINQPKGNEVGAGISIEALEDEGIDLTSLVCDPLNSNKEGPYVFHFPPNPALNRTSGIERKFSSNDSPSYERICEVLQRNSAALQHKSNESAIKMVYDPETDKNIVIQVTGMSHSGSPSFKNSLKKSKKESENKASVNCSSSSSASDLQRTRSGRISRPPQHRVKDYKLLRRVNYDTNLTDALNQLESDGKRLSFADDNNIHRKKRNGLSPLARERYTCPTCKKLYMGQQKLLRHYRQYPKHLSDALASGLREESKTDDLVVDNTGENLAAVSGCSTLPEKQQSSTVSGISSLALNHASHRSPNHRNGNISNGCKDFDCKSKEFPVMDVDEIAKQTSVAPASEVPELNSVTSVVPHAVDVNLSSCKEVLCIGTSATNKCEVNDCQKLTKNNSVQLSAMVPQTHPTSVDGASQGFECYMSRAETFPPSVTINSCVRSKKTKPLLPEISMPITTMENGSSNSSLSVLKPKCLTIPLEEMQVNKLPSVSTCSTLSTPGGSVAFNSGHFSNSFRPASLVTLRDGAPDHELFRSIEPVRPCVPSPKPSVKCEEFLSDTDLMKLDPNLEAFMNSSSSSDATDFENKNDSCEMSPPKIKDNFEDNIPEISNQSFSIPGFNNFDDVMSKQELEMPPLSAGINLFVSEPTQLKISLSSTVINSEKSSSKTSSALSPTPGTRPTEVNPEPSLPVETDCGFHPRIHLPRAGSVVSPSVPQNKLSSVGGSPMKTHRNSTRDAASHIKSNDVSPFESPAKVLSVASNAREGSAKDASSSLKVHIKKNSNDEYFAVTQVHTEQPVLKTLTSTLTSQSSSEHKGAESVRPTIVSDGEAPALASSCAPLAKKKQNKTRGRGRGRGRGRSARGSSSPVPPPVAESGAFPALIALNDTLNSLPASEVASTVFPRLQRDIPLWEILCLQASCSPNIAASCNNAASGAVSNDKLKNAVTLLSKLLDQCRSELKNVLHPIPILENELPPENSKGRAVLQVPENVALAIGMKSGKYRYKDTTQSMPLHVTENAKSKEKDFAKISVRRVEEESGQKGKNMFHCNGNSVSSETITNLEEKSGVNLNHCNVAPSVPRTFVTTERQNELLNSVLSAQPTITEESVADFGRLTEIKSSLVQATTATNIEAGSHSTKCTNLVAVPEISTNDNPLLHSKILSDDRHEIVKNVSVDCATTLPNLKPIHQSILSEHGSVNMTDSSFLVPEIETKRNPAILESDTETKNTVQSKINSDCKAILPHAIACGSETNSSPFDRPYSDVSKSDPLIGFSSGAVGNSHPGSSSFIISITQDPISSIRNGVNSNQISSSLPVKSNLLSDREEKLVPSPIEFSPLSFAECTTSYDLSSFLLQGATPPLDTNAGRKSPVRTVQDNTLSALGNSAKFSQMVETSLDVINLQTQSGAATQRSNSLNEFISPSLEVSVPYSNESNNCTNSPAYAFGDRPTDLGKTNDSLKPQLVSDNLAYQGNSLSSTTDNTNVSRNELHYNACPNSSNYIPSSVFDTLYLQPNALPNLVTKFSADNQALSTSVQDSSELTKSAPSQKKSRKSTKEKARSNSSFLSKFTNANFKEVDTPSSNQPIASLIHSQSMAEKNKKVDEKKNNAHSNLKKKTPKKRDACALPKVSLNSDNSAVYGPLQDASLHNISDNGSIVAQPATSPISALLQSSFHSVLTQDAVGVVCNERTNVPSHPFTDSSLTAISERSVSRNLPNQNLTFAESLGNTSINCNHPSNTRTVVSPAGFHPASSPTQSFTFPISACGENGNGAVDGNTLSINSSLPSSFDVNSSAMTSSYVASLSTFIPPSTHCINVSSSTYNSMSLSSQPHPQHPTIPSPKSSCCLTQPYSSPVSSYVLTSSMPSPSNSYVIGPNVAQKTLLRNGSSGLSGSMTPPPLSQNCFASPIINSSVPSFPRITSPVMNHDGSMLYTSSRIAAGSSMSPPLSSLLPTSHVNHHGLGPAGSPAGSPLCPNPIVARNGCTTPLRGSTRPLLSPTTLLGLPFSSISPDIANLEPPLPCTSGSIPALSELELTSDDLPRLLSTGDSSSQSCGASKLLDTNTADLTEIIQKLQQETADSACLETSDAQLSASVASEFRPPAPSFKGVLQSKADVESVCVHSASLNDAGAAKTSGLPCFGNGSTSNPNPVSLVASVPPRTDLCQSNALRDLQLSDPSLSPNCTMITSFTDVLSSNAHFSNTALSQLTSSASACVIADPGGTHRNGAIQCQEETSLLRQVTSTETVVQNMLDNVMPINMDQRVQNNSVQSGKLVNSISHCDQFSTNENRSRIQIQNSPVHSKILPSDQSLRSVKSSTLQKSNILSRSEKLISNSRTSTEFPDQLTSVVRTNESIGSGVVSNGTHVFHGTQNITSPDNVSTFRSLPHNSLTPSGHEQHSFTENTPCQQYCDFSRHANGASSTDFSRVTRAVDGESAGRISTTTSSVPIADMSYDY